MSEILIGSNPDDVNATTSLPQTAEEKAMTSLIVDS